MLFLMATIAVATLSETFVEPRIIDASGLVVTGTFDDRVEIAVDVAMPEGSPDPNLGDTDFSLYAGAGTGVQEQIDAEVVSISIARQETMVGLDATTDDPILAVRRVLRVTFETDPVDGGNAPHGLRDRSSLRLVAAPKNAAAGTRTWEASHPDIDVRLTFACGFGLPNLIKIGGVVLVTLGVALVVFLLVRRRLRSSNAARRLSLP